MVETTMRNGTNGAGYRGGGRSPIGIGGAVAVHGAALAVFLLMPREMIDEVTRWKPFTGVNVPIESPPPPEDTAIKQDPNQTQPADRPTRTETIVPLPHDSVLDPGPVTESGDGTGTGGYTIVAPPPTLPDPVFVEAGIDPRTLSTFQPDYPGAMIRQSQEGTVTVRVQIGPDGRVTDIERIAATDDAFWLATQRHALRKWRFRAATRDGMPVASTKILTVHFRLENQ